MTTFSFYFLVYRKSNPAQPIKSKPIENATQTDIDEFKRSYCENIGHLNVICFCNDENMMTYIKVDDISMIQLSY